MFVVTPDAELDDSSKVLVPRTPLRRIMHADVQHVHAALVGAVIPTHIRDRPSRLENNRNAVQFCMTGMEDVTRHENQTGAPKKRSNAEVNSPAMAWGERPSI